MTPETALRIADNFFAQVWTAPQDFHAIDKLVAEDFTIVSGGQEIHSRVAFKAWAIGFAARIRDLHFEVVERFANPEGTRVATRWRLSGLNNGVLGTEPNGEPVEMTGTAILEIRPDGLIQTNWVERSAWEVFHALRSGTTA